MRSKILLGEKIYLTKEEQDFLYKIYLKELSRQKTKCGDEKYKLLERLYKIGIIRKLKMAHSNEKQVILTNEGLVLAVIISRLRGDFRYNKKFAIGYW